MLQTAASAHDAVPAQTLAQRVPAQTLAQRHSFKPGLRNWP